MNFWQRRSIARNLIGSAIASVTWIGLELGLTAIASDADPFAFEHLAIVPILVATLIVTLLYDRMPLAWVGLAPHRWTGRELAAGTLLGIAMALLAWSPAALHGRVFTAPPAPAGFVLDLFFFLLLSAALEELLFRGYLFQRLVELTGPLLATLLASAGFAAAHLWNPGITAFALVNIFLASILFTLAYFRTGSLWAPIACHAGWNMTLALVVGVPVSGQDFGGILWRTIDASPQWIGGGTFGPEGGVAATVALGLGALVVLRHPWLTLSPYVHAAVFASVYRHERERNGATGAP
jgi:membrane protease YdiL (CAAX protease family)